MKDGHSSKEKISNNRRTVMLVKTDMSQCQRIERKMVPLNYLSIINTARGMARLRDWVREAVLSLSLLKLGTTKHIFSIVKVSNKYFNICWLLVGDSMVYTSKYCDDVRHDQK